MAQAPRLSVAMKFAGRMVRAALPQNEFGTNKSFQVGMNGDTFSIKAPKECSKKFAATFKGKIPTRGNVLRIFLLFLEDFGAPL